MRANTHPPLPAVPDAEADRFTLPQTSWCLVLPAWTDWSDLTELLGYTWKILQDQCPCSKIWMHFWMLLSNSLHLQRGHAIPANGQGISWFHHTRLLCRRINTIFIPDWVFTYPYKFIKTCIFIHLQFFSDCTVSKRKMFSTIFKGGAAA